MPYILAANAVDKNPARAPRGNRQKTIAKQALFARRSQGGNSHRLHIRAINWEPMASVVKQSIFAIPTDRIPPVPRLAASTDCASCPHLYRKNHSTLAGIIAKIIGKLYVSCNGSHYRTSTRDGTRNCESIRDVSNGAERWIRICW